MLTAYTTYHDIRAALGVSDEELDDGTLSLQLYEDHLLADLGEISFNLAGFFATVLAKPTPTDEETRFLSYVRLFSTYSVAKTLTTTLPLFAPRSIEDGKARVQRFDSPYKDTIAAVGREYEKWKNRLQQAFMALGEGSTTRTQRSWLSVVSPGSDPVTGT